MGYLRRNGVYSRDADTEGGRAGGGDEGVSVTGIDGAGNLK